MKIKSMRSEGAEDPVIIATLENGESAAPGMSVECEAGIVEGVVGAEVVIRVVDRSLRRRIQDGLTKLVIDSPAVRADLAAARAKAAADAAEKLAAEAVEPAKED